MDKFLWYTGWILFYVSVVTVGACLLYAAMTGTLFFLALAAIQGFLAWTVRYQLNNDDSFEEFRDDGDAE